ncbi:hypothetical protein [Burkholderia gladioli]|uniref:hypothetical protein n=1 Tax=Burkholderia gladioli TaxID=28095 RepID=UPI003EE3CCED
MLPGALFSSAGSATMLRLKTGEVALGSPLELVIITPSTVFGHSPGVAAVSETVPAAAVAFLAAPDASGARST